MQIGNGFIGESFIGSSDSNSTTVTKNIDGKSRLQKNVSQTQTGKVRLQKNVLAVQSGTSRLQKNVVSSLTGQTRLQKNVLITQAGKSRVLKKIVVTQSGKVNIFSSFVPTKIYSRDKLNSLPANNSDLNTLFSAQDKTDVGTSDGVRVSIPGNAYLIQQFRYEGQNNTSAINITWRGRAAHSAAQYPVYLQIYNHSTSLWETIASETGAAAQTDFNLIASVITNQSNYYDGSLMVSVRVFQLVGGSN